MMKWNIIMTIVGIVLLGIVGIMVYRYAFYTGITRSEARHIAEQKIASGPEMVITNQIRVWGGWMFFYTSKEHKETGDSKYEIPGTNPFLVRTNGEIRTISFHEIEERGFLRTIFFGLD